MSHKGVEGVIVCTYDGVPLRSTLPREASVQLAGLYSALASKCRGTVRTIDGEVSRGAADGGRRVAEDSGPPLVRSVG